MSDFYLNANSTKLIKVTLEAFPSFEEFTLVGQHFALVPVDVPVVEVVEEKKKVDTKKVNTPTNVESKNGKGPKRTKEEKAAYMREWYAKKKTGEKIPTPTLPDTHQAPVKTPSEAKIFNAEEPKPVINIATELPLALVSKYGSRTVAAVLKNKNNGIGFTAEELFSQDIDGISHLMEHQLVEIVEQLEEAGF